MIRLQFVQGPDISSRAIAWFSAGHFSHVDAFFDNGLLGARSDEIWGRGSWIGPGVKLRPQNYAKWPKRVVMEIKTTMMQETAFRRFLYNQLNKPYDKTAIVAFLFNRNWREADSWFCSELQAAALEYCGVFPKLYVDSNKITPVALSLAFSAAGGYVV